MADGVIDFNLLRKPFYEGCELCWFILILKLNMKILAHLPLVKLLRTLGLLWSCLVLYFAYKFYMNQAGANNVLNIPKGKIVLNHKYIS